MKEIVAYTDGSAVVNGKNKGRAGYGVYFPNLYGKKTGFSKSFIQGKTGEMEVRALLCAIKAVNINNGEKVTLKVYSDSQYVVKTFTESRIYRWRARSWDGIANVKLWKQILRALKNRPFLKLEMIHIKSHQVEKEKNPVAKAYLLQDPHIVGNMMADKLADYKRGLTIKNK